MMLRAKPLDFDATWSVLQHQVSRGAARRCAPRKARVDKGTASCSAPSADEANQAALVQAGEGCCGYPPCVCVCV
jgi:hypothetical protein